MKPIYLSNPVTKGIAISTAEKNPQLMSMFGLSCGFDASILECSGLVYLDTDAGRFEGEKWETVSVEDNADGLTIVQKAGNTFQIKINVVFHKATGVFNWKLSLDNLDEKDHTVYACLPRFVMLGGDYQVFAQYSSWCAENQGAWVPLHAGNLVLTNSGGRSCDTGTPFACIQDQRTGNAMALHVLPIGDWIIKFRRVSGHRKCYTVLEAGLSDASMRMNISAGEVIELPELLFCGFTGDAENCGIPIQRYLLERYPGKELPGLVYNTWFFDYDILDPERLREQARLAKQIGCQYFVVDAGWFGQGEDWENQVGCWKECSVRAFKGQMRDFADYVRQLGMGFGLWMDLENTTENTEVYQQHPEWFLEADAVIYDLSQEAVTDYLAQQFTRVVKTYQATWVKWDHNNDMLRDLLGDNYYSYYLGEHQLLEKIRQMNPGCHIEGCAGGGMRSDAHNVMENFDGHFITDSVHPYEVLRMRQHASTRLLPTFLGSWAVLQEVDFPISEYEKHDRFERKKTYSCGDAWWEHTVDVDLDFAVYTNLMGGFGLTGDLTSLSQKTLDRLQQAAEFYEDHRKFMSRSVCHLLTRLQPLNSIEGWVVMQYENVDGLGSIVYAFRMVDDLETMYVYPRNLEQDRSYQLVQDNILKGTYSGAELTQHGIAVHCAQRYRASRLEILPL